MFSSLACVTGHATPVPGGTTAVRTCAVDGVTGLYVSRKWNDASASTTGAVTFSARLATAGWTLTSVTNTPSQCH